MVSTSLRNRTAAIAAACLIAVGLQAPFVVGKARAATDPCAAPVTSVIACENSLPGAPSSDWDVAGTADTSIVGYATQISVNAGNAVNFKVKTSAKAYHLDIYRLGYYQGNGARLIASGIKPTAALPQSQPNCLTDSSTGLIDCGNWGQSASWAVPSAAVSGIYQAKLVREDTGGVNLMTFVVRNDSRASDVLVQASDTTWQAYNDYGGNSLYTCSVSCPPGNPLAYKGAFKVSYNRPFGSVMTTNNWVMSTEYPMIRFLEQNGYDVSYVSGLDVSVNAGLLSGHKVFLSSGHDEYWSADQRTNVTNARNSGLNLAFFSGNEMFWKTRWEPAISSDTTANRTLVSYKDTHFDAPTDPVTWTGTWRDPRFSPPASGGNPENALTGQFFLVNSGTSDIQVPAAYGGLRIWRNTAAASLSSGQTLTLGSGLGTLGYEWDEDADNGFRPGGSIRMSSTTVSVPQMFTDYGSTIAAGTVTHNLTLYRASSGALVFGAGTVQWSWGLDNYTTDKSTDKNMQQATVNILADMGIQPATLMTGLLAPSASTDTTAPTSTITSPAANASVNDGTQLTISGTAADTGGKVAGVEVSTDGGSTWHRANGTTSWTYSWVAHGNPSTVIKSRATDDSANTETPGTGNSVTVNCPCTVMGTAMAPAAADSGDGSAVEIGMKFRSDVGATVTGVRFYKATTNTGTHVGNLWTASGTKLASATFSNESSSGWQTVNFASPVQIQANTTYVVSYYAPGGHYAQTSGYFYPNPSPPPDGSSSVDSAPLHALRNSPSSGGGNGLYLYTGSSAFPTSTYHAENYWVDAVISGQAAPAAPTVTTTSPGSGATGVATTTAVSATFSENVSASSIKFVVLDTAGTSVPGTVAYNSTSFTATFTPSSALSNSATYTATVSGATDSNGLTMSPYTWSFTTAPAPGSCPCTIFSSTDTPSVIGDADSSSVELGVKFRADTSGKVTGVRFYKAGTNTGTHTGSLWTASGTRLATVTFSNETTSGWQQALFSSPVTISANTTYIVSYHAPAGHYSDTANYFTSSGKDSPPLHALQSGVDGANGVYIYSTSTAFPTQSYQDTNYYVDVVFDNTTTAPTAPGAPTNVTATSGNASATVNWTAPSDGGSTITSYTITPYIGTTAQTPTTITGTPPATTATVAGLTNGTTYTFTVYATNGVGAGPASAASNAVTPSASTPAPTVPAAPTNVTATAGNKQATITWTAPSDGGSTITSYTITPYVGTAARTATTITGNPPATTVTVTGLTNGTTYTFTVKATNAVGTGPESAPSNAVTPKNGKPV